MKGKKKKKVTSSSREQLQFREISRLVPFFVYWRKHDLGDESDVVTHKEVFSFNRLNIQPRMIEYALNRSNVFYQCITISYCADNYGRTYKLFGFAQTNEPVITLEEDISPLIYASRAHAESNANTKHIKGHAMVLAPLLRQGVDLGTVVVSLKDKLELDAKELSELQECINDNATFYDVERRDRDAVENEIAKLLD